MINWRGIIRPRGGAIIAGDFNPNSHSWDARFKELHDVTFRTENIDEHGPELGNDDEPIHHCARDDEQDQLTIDPSLGSRPITLWTRLVGGYGHRLKP